MHIYHDFIKCNITKHNRYLGWDIQTRYLRVILPKEKDTAWVQDIRASLASKKNKLETLIGKINNAAHISPQTGYFLNLLYHLLKRGNKWGTQRLRSWNKQYLQLCIKILHWVTDKVAPINNILFTIPKVTLWSNSLKCAIGRYSNKGISCRWRIPPELHGVLILNLL